MTNFQESLPINALINAPANASSNAPGDAPIDSTTSANPEDKPPFWQPPDVSKAAFIAPTATVMGQVELGEGASVWFSAVVRGDVERIVIGRCSNVQDGAVLHCDPGKPTILGDYVTVGHRAVIHSAHIERGCLIGIGAIVLDDVRVGEGSIVGAGSVVTKNVPPRSLVVGIPGRIARTLSDEEAEGLINHALKYEQLALVHAGRGTNIGFVPES
ncbi:MAG TPA: gamma carbonic anhydrase family protein [Chroococcidiopsis sp.]